MRTIQKMFRSNSYKLLLNVVGGSAIGVSRLNDAQLQIDADFRHQVH